MNNELYRLVYCSRSDVEHDAHGMREELLRILAVSRANNVRFGVTGALLFSAGCFAQTLEGPLAAIERTFERIQCDRRHREVTVLQVERSAGRVFGEWSMAFAGDQAGSHPLAAMTLDQAFTRPPGDAAQEVLTMLEALVRAEEAWVTPA